MTSIRSRIVGHGEESPDQLLANPRNWRVHPKAQQDALAGVLDQVGWVQNVIVNRRTGYVVDGHLRVSLAISRGEATVPVVYVDLDESEEALVLASLDPLSAMATTDEEMLAALLEDVVAEGALADMLSGLVTEAEPKAGNTDPDDVPEEPETPYVKRGDVYALGGHRVMCGDATSAEDVATLLDGATPTLMITDPPYGVDYDPEWRNRALGEANRAVGTVINDDRADWREAYALFPGDVAYVWHAGSHAHEVAESVIGAGYEIRAQIVWSKQHFVISRGHYHGRHEPCWYAVRKGRTAHWIGDRSQSTVWEINKGLTQGGPRADHDAVTGHGTQKPVECMERPMRNHSGDAYDPFLGSGTTLIAAERLSRRCYGMDIEPKYVQVAIERWEAFTGEKAVKVNG